MMSLYSFLSAIELGLIYSLMVLGLFLSYRVLNIPDLTVDGSFTLGAAVAVVMTLSRHPILGLFAAILAGAAAGFLTAFLQTKMKIQPILAGIITMTALYSINLMVMDDKANVPITQQESIYTAFGSLVGKRAQGMVLSLLVLILAGAAMVLFLKTPFGLSVRATGDNESMVRSSSINPNFTITIGLCVANALTGLSGAVVGQAQKTADINSGTGIVVIGLACLIIGETIVGRGAMFRGAIAVVAGSILYRLVYALVLYTKVVPVDCLKLVTALVVALAIAAPSIRQWWAFQTRKRRALAGRKGEK